MVIFDKIIKETIIKNKKSFIVGLVILAFICLKFFLTYVLWKDRFNPPSFDDAYFYIGNINQIADQGNFDLKYHKTSVARYFTYYASITPFLSLGIEPEKVFHLFFYIGIVFLPFILYTFLRSFFNENVISSSFILGSLASFHGQVSYHGFFWVVPSFIMFLFFLSFISALSENKIILALLLSIPFLLSHPLAAYLIMFCFLYFLTYFICVKKWKIIFIFLTTLSIISFFQFTVLKIYNYKGVTLNDHSSILYIFDKLKENLNDIKKKYTINNANKINSHNIINEKTNLIDTNQSSANIVLGKKNIDYFFSEFFNPIFYNRAFFTLLLLAILNAIILRKTKLLFIYILSILTGLIASALYFLGFRLLYLSWFFTFVIIGHLFYSMYQYPKKLFKISSLFLILIFILFGLKNNLAIAQKMNAENDFYWNKSCILKEIKREDNNKIYSSDKYATSLLTYLGYYDIQSFPDSDPRFMRKNKGIIFSSENDSEHISKVFESKGIGQKIKNNCGFILVYEYE